MMVLLTSNFCELRAADWAALESMEDTSEAIDAAAPIDALEGAVAVTGVVATGVATADDVTLFEAADGVNNVLEVLDVVLVTLATLLLMVLF